jgi:folylpolyglutamate synthase
VESLTCCGEWVYGEDGMSSTPTSTEGEGGRNYRILIFNCTNGRSAYDLLEALLGAGKKVLKRSSLEGVGSWFDRVVFCTNVTYTDGGFKGGESG